MGIPLKTTVLIIAALCFLIPPPASAEWVSSFVDTSNCVGVDPKIAVDATIYPHIVHYDVANISLKYSYYDGAAWHHQLLDEGNASRNADLALDTASRTHLSYTRSDGLAYGLREGGKWTLKVIALNPGAGAESTSLALDGLGHPHIVYAASGGLAGGGVSYHRFDGSAWVSQNLGVEGTQASLALDSIARPYVCYIEPPLDGSPFGRLVLARKPAGEWIFESPDEAARVKGQTDIAVDGDNNVHLIYHDWPAGLVKYAKFNGYSWEIHVLSTNGGLTEGLGLALDRQGRPNVVFNTKAFNLVYGLLEDTGWIFEEVSTHGGADVTIDSIGRPHVAHGQDAEGRVPQPWPIGNCEVLKYSVRR